MVCIFDDKDWICQLIKLDLGLDGDIFLFDDVCGWGINGLKSGWWLCFDSVRIEYINTYIYNEAKYAQRRK